MTQAYNLSQLANNLNTAGQLDATDGLVNAVPVANGGTAATTAAAALVNLGASSLDSPAFTGLPTAPTAAVNTNTTQLATTAMVVGQAASVTPLIESGSGAVGTSLRYARGDHVHPAVAVVASSGRLLRITRYTTAGSGTWTRPGDTVSVLIKTVAGGGGGGGGDSIDRGGAGGGGGYAELYIASASASYAYTVGAGGTAGNSSGISGGAGAATTIAGIASGGGDGGAYLGGGIPYQGGIPTGGTINIRGGASGIGLPSLGGQGAGGLGGGPSTTIAAAGSSFGTGGNGCTTGVAGVGGAGYIEITEYS